MSYYNNRHAFPVPQQGEDVDLDDDINASGEWDNRFSESSRTIRSSYSIQPIDKPYKQQLAPFQQNPTVDNPLARKVQFPFGDLQKVDTQGSAAFSSAWRSS